MRSAGRLRIIGHVFIIVAVLSIVLPSGVVNAQTATFWQKSSVTLDVTYASQYLGRRGVSFFGDGPALTPSAHVNIGGSGWYAGVWAALALDDGCKEPFGDYCSDWDEYDYYFGYSSSIWNNERRATKYDLNYTYLSYIKQERLDDQEVGLSVSHPDLLPVIGWSRPAIYWGLYYLWPVYGDGDGRREVQIGFSYDIPIETQSINAFLDALWADRAGGAIDDDGIMRYRGGLSTTFEGFGFALTPALFYQQAIMETDPADWIKSEFWFKISVSRLF